MLTYLNASEIEASKGIRMYWDKTCTLKVLSIDWGVLSPGMSKEIAVYVRNEGNQTLFLILSTTNWNPSTANQYLIFSWNYKDIRIVACEVVTVTQKTPNII